MGFIPARSLAIIIAKLTNASNRWTTAIPAV